MLTTEQIQRTIHNLEQGTLSRWIKWLPMVAGVIALAVLYDVRAYKDFSSPEAMDAAQVARNLSEGKGYTTDCIRPFSIYLVKKHNLAVQQASGSTSTNAADLARLNGNHPDLANPPLYPTVLAGLMKIKAPDWKIELKKPFWSEGGKFLRYRPEFAIAVFNQFLLLLVVLLTFVIARKLFDLQAAWIAALLTLGSDLLWQFSSSGLSTLL